MTKNKIITEEECLELGGHCYVNDNFTYPCNPPMSSRTCKHCGNSQYSIQQPSMRWVDKLSKEEKEKIMKRKTNGVE